MSKIDIDVEYKEVDDLLNRLDDEETKKKILIEGLKSGAKVLQEKTQDLFKARMGQSAYHQSRFLKGKPFYEGVKMTVDKAYNEVIVGIMSDFRMRFFEKGTKERVTKKGHRRGRIEPKWFFRDARSSTTDEIEDTMNRSIDIAMRKYIV